MISVSLGKIAQSRVTRAGCSLHKSLMVASILQKARHLYVEQTFMMHCRSPVSPPPSPAPPAPIEDDAPTYTDLDTCSPAERGVSTPVSTSVSSAGSQSSVGQEPHRRKRLISDEETEEAVASILPKRPRVEGSEDECAPAVEVDITGQELSHNSTEETPSSEKDSGKDGDSDDSDDSCYESGDSDVSEEDAMEIDRITSLVSVFSFDKLRSGSSPSPVEAATESYGHCEWDRTADTVRVHA